MSTTTQVFADKDAWRAAGRPPGGIYPLPDRDRSDAKAQGRLPERYRDVQAYFVVLPSGAHWCPWWTSYSAETEQLPDGWDISGTIPDAMTVTPDIVTPGYSGSLTAGVFTP